MQIIVILGDRHYSGGNTDTSEKGVRDCISKIEQVTREGGPGSLQG